MARDVATTLNPLSRAGHTPTAAPATEVQVLARIVQRWPGWLMLVDADHRVLACSAALAAAVAPDPIGAKPNGDALRCTRWVHSGGARGCCLDYGLALADLQSSALVQLDLPQGRAQAASARLEPIALADGATAWLVHLEPCGGTQPEDAAWHDMIAARGATDRDRDAWLAQLSQRWVRPLVRPRWAGWLHEAAGDDRAWHAASGRLPRGLTQHELRVRAATARAGADATLPVTLAVAGDLLHLVPSGAAPAWVLALLGGHVDAARATMLCGLVKAVAAAHDVCGSAAVADPPAAPPPTATLTVREAQIVHLVAQGLPDKRIAQRLGLSFHTVRNHLRRIMFKLGVHTRAQIAFALAARTER